MGNIINKHAKNGVNDVYILLDAILCRCKRIMKELGLDSNILTFVVQEYDNGNTKEFNIKGLSVNNAKPITAIQVEKDGQYYYVKFKDTEVSVDHSNIDQAASFLLYNYFSIADRRLAKKFDFINSLYERDLNYIVFKGFYKIETCVVSEDIEIRKIITFNIEDLEWESNTCRIYIKTTTTKYKDPKGSIEQTYLLRSLTHLPVIMDNALTITNIDRAILKE